METRTIFFLHDEYGLVVLVMSVPGVVVPATPIIIPDYDETIPTADPLVESDTDDTPCLQCGYFIDRTVPDWPGEDVASSVSTS